MEAEASKIIESLGGTCAVAEIFKVSAQAVSQWRKDGIPPARMMYLKLAYPDACNVPKHAPVAAPPDRPSDDRRSPEPEQEAA
jgi:hypothetical protein